MRSGANRDRLPLHLTWYGSGILRRFDRLRVARLARRYVGKSGVRVRRAVARAEIGEVEQCGKRGEYEHYNRKIDVAVHSNSASCTAVIAKIQSAVQNA